MSVQTLTIGVFGLARGGHLAAIAASLPGVRVVAGCDASAGRRDTFRASHPDAVLAPTYADLLALRFDVLILASFCPDHGPQAVQALQAGKHVLSEVTAFHTPAEGVALVEAVEQGDRLYMMAENTCFRARALEARRLVREGFLGEFLYGQCEYIHDIRPLMRNPDGTAHWRAWLPPTFYTTHPLGELLTITGERPASVTGTGIWDRVPGSANPMDYGAFLVTTASGAQVHVAASFASARDGQWLSLQGTEGVIESARWGDRNALLLHQHGVGAPDVPASSYLADYPAEMAHAAASGHGGADYWPVYYFVRAVRDGVPPPMDVYDACDFTLPGIMAYRSALLGGMPQAVPDWRDVQTRDRYRQDTASPPRVAR